jgi:molecular chaperone GrpE (heat shock protein)
MAQTPRSNNANTPFQQVVLEQLEKLSTLEEDISELKDEVRRSNEKFDNYQKATQWVVQLAFSLIAAATVTVIVSSVLGK